MNTDNGKLAEYLEEDGINSLNKAIKGPNPWIEVPESDMTMRQKETMQVSEHDHRSPLGKQLTAIQQRKRVFGR